MNTKNSTLFILLAFIVSAAHSQTLTEGSFPVAGDVFSMTLAADTAGFNTGASGTNVTWNFGSLTAGVFTQVDSFMSPASTPYGGVVPNATIAFHDITPPLNNQYIYFADNTNAGAFQRVANILPDTVLYSTPGSEFPYPYSYGSTLSGTYYTKYNTSGGQAIEAGTVTGSADGAGILINPYGTYTNVLRTHAVRNENDTTSGGTPGTLVEDYYNWYQPNSYYPIMEYSKTVVSVLGHVAYQATVIGYRQGYASSAVNDISNDNTGWMVFPNPASHQATVTFQAADNGKTDITLYDISGRALQQLSVENAAGALQTTQLNLETEPAGVYMITIKNSNGMATRKLEVAR